MLSLLWPAVTSAAVLAVVVGGMAAAVWRARAADRRRGRTPLPDRLLRPAGTHLRGQLDGVREKADFWIAAGFAVPLAAAAPLARDLVRGEARPVQIAALAAVLLPFCGVVWWKTHRLFRDHLRLATALDAELAAAAELDRLMLDGWRVFHDVQDTRCGNVDHVLVGPGGLYAVETKSIHKPYGKGGHRVVVDAGRGTLRLAGGDRTFDREQCFRNAAVLEALLTERLGEPPPVRVEPLLCLPGYFVERKSPAVPRAMNPKSAALFVRHPQTTGPLAPDQIERIANTLDDYCRSLPPSVPRRRG